MSDTITHTDTKTRSELVLTIGSAVLAHVFFVGPMITRAFDSPSQGVGIVPVSGPVSAALALQQGGATAESVTGSFEVAAQLDALPSVVAVSIVIATVLRPVLWTAVIVLFVLLCRKAMRGGLHSDGFGRLLAWTGVSTFAALFLPDAFLHMGANGVIARMETPDAYEPATFLNIGVLFLIAAVMTLAFVMHRSAKRLSDDLQGTV